MRSVLRWAVLATMLITLVQARPRLEEDAERVSEAAGKPVEPKVPQASPSDHSRTVYEIIVSTSDLQVDRKKKMSFIFSDMKTIVLILEDKEDRNQFPRCANDLYQQSPNHCVRRKNRPKPGPLASRLITGPDPFLDTAPVVSVASPAEPSISFSGATLVFNSEAKVQPVAS